MNLLKIFNINITNLNRKEIFTIYSIYILLIIITSLIFCKFYIDKYPNMIDENFNLILKKIPFHHGELIQNLFNSWKFEQNYLGTKFVLLKMPVLPILLSLISKITLNFYLIIIIKNVLLFSLLFFVLFFCLKSLNLKTKYFALLITTFFYNPYNLFTSLNFEYEDFLIIILLPSIFCLLISKLKNRYLLISILMFFLYLTKTSMFLICIVLPILIIFYEKSEKQKIKKFLPFIAIIIAINLWGGFGYFKTGKFPFGSKLASINSNALSVALNENFHLFYPNKSVDLIQDQYIISESINNEWEFFDYFQEKNKKYLNENFNRYFKDSFIKLKFIFFGIYKDGVHPDKDGNFKNPIRFSNLFNKIFLNSAFILSLIYFFKNIKNFFKMRNEFYFLSIFSLNIFPHVVAWATSKHLVAISIIGILYLIFKFVEITEEN